MPSRPSGNALKSAMRAVHPTDAVLATLPASSPSWISKTPNVC
jgi:hypothetical protein